MSKSKKADVVPENYVRLEGSERRPSAKAKLIGAADENETFSVTIVLRRRMDGEPVPDYDYYLKIPPSQRRRLPEDAFAAKYGAHPDELQKVVAFAESQGLTVDDTNAAQRAVTVSGTVAQMSKAFAVKLNRRQHEITLKRGVSPQVETYRSREGFIYVPANLDGIIIGVFGLDNRNITKINGGDPPNTATITIPTVRDLYNFPGNSAAGQTIGIFCGLTEYGDGYSASDIQQYFAGLPAGYPMPSLTDISVHGSNSGSDPFGEITQDIDIAGTAAPGASIVVYFTTHSQQGWVDCVKRVIHPEAGDATCSVLSSSYYVSDGDDADGIAASPDGVTTAWLNAVDMYFQDAAILGVTVSIATGDTGTDSKVGDGKAHVQFPASDPWVLAVGGTTIGNVSGNTFDEYVWNDTFVIEGFSGSGATGGGISALFNSLPSYQSNANVPVSINDGHVGRGIPDVAANASPNSGYPITIGGAPAVANGTSASAPLWAGLIAVINAAIGDNVGFVNPALYAIGSSAFRDILGEPGPVDNSQNGVVGYPAGPGWDACTGWGSPDGVALVSALGSLYHQNFYFIVDKSTYGTDEVSDVITSNSGLFPNAFWLVLEGFSIQQVNGAVPTLSGAFNAFASAHISSAGAPDYEFPGDQFIPQRIRFPYNITFNSTTGFPAAGSETPEVLNASISVGTLPPLNAETLFELVGGSDPYFTNVDPSNTNAVFYLSQDLRVFSVAANQSPVPGAPAFTSDPYGSIQNFLGYLNSMPEYTVPVIGSDPLNNLPGQNNYEGAESSVTPLNGANQQNYNFAIARVRLQDTAALATASDVRVFFRLFMAQSFDTDFQPSTTYLSTLGGPGPDMGLPVFPLPSATGLVDPQGNTLQTIPYFCSDIAGTHDYDGTLMNSNIRDITIPTGQDKIWAYYGCFLDVFNSNNQSKFGGTHHCLVAQIAYDDTPIVNSNGVTWSPESSDKLAQRNLQITSSGNPSYPATHLIPQAFDMRPSGPVSATAGLLLDYPDEMMIDWGNTPEGTLAQIYWPQIDSSEITQLATNLYGTHLLTAADAHTVECTVTKGVTYIPIPTATGINFAGLFTLKLPRKISIGMEFNVKVRRVTSRKPDQYNEPGNEQAAYDSKGRIMRNWRYITGTFQVKIPVAADEPLLLPEENTLAILKWRLEHMSKEYRWYPIIEKYIEDVSIRVNGFGGNAGSIKPSLNGIPSKIIPVHREITEYVGKVCEVVYNCFGELEGFVLEKCCSERRVFKCHEKSVGELVSHACRERYTIAVFVKEKCEDKICEIRVYP